MDADKSVNKVKDKKKAERDETIEQINALLSSPGVQIGMAVVAIVVFIGFLYYGIFAR